MKLYHFSQNDFDVINPKFFGYNSFSKNETKFSLPRIFCYDTAKPQEKCFAFARFRYSLKIAENKIYNLDTDKLGLKEKFNFDVDKILAFTAKNFHGIKYNTSFLTYVIFKPCKVTKKENLVCGIAWI
jgi:hypothetical protein